MLRRLIILNYFYRLITSLIKLSAKEECVFTEDTDEAYLFFIILLCFGVVISFSLDFILSDCF